jgi:hypothetical protein
MEAVSGWLFSAEDVLRPRILATLGILLGIVPKSGTYSNIEWHPEQVMPVEVKSSSESIDISALQ